ncbi:trafficking protein particle complex subunit 4-like [Sinocyclocheilus anshuiensis]|uniref:trafficking protein particle complex subunit 4-like n=1 Tax=Sinocyclocheilus anshuiensis TaxID=1608454 RepID=UPI0007B7E1AB|nr:PREDICTED: trafficking protein particle complex subunit 4-like [Sinocyclocheilus anshuiensis]
MMRRWLSHSDSGTGSERVCVCVSANHPMYSYTVTVGHAVLSINGVDVNVKYTAEGKEILEYLRDPANYPVSIRFGRPRLTSNEKLMLASMFHSLFAIGSQLSPEVGSSGIEMLETDMFKLHCCQTLTGLFFSCCIKFIVLADPRQSGIDALLRKIYEIYSDFALKNPFYSLEMPIRCVLFFSYNFVICLQLKMHNTCSLKHVY